MTSGINQHTKNEPSGKLPGGSKGDTRDILARTVITRARRAPPQRLE